MTTGRTLRRLDQVGIGELRQVGPRRRAAFSEMGIDTVLDLLTHYPTRYEDWTEHAAIAQLREGDTVSVVGSIRRVQARRGRGRAALVEVVVADGTGELSVSFFNQAWRARQLRAGVHVVVSGKVGCFRQQLQMANPRLVSFAEEEPPPAGQIVPIYPESEKAGIGSVLIARCAGEALDRAGPFADPLPATWRSELGLVERTAAFGGIHRPQRAEDHRRSKRRLAFDELFRLQVALVMRKRLAEAEARGIVHLVEPPEPGRRLVEAFLSGLPFELTAAQSRVMAEIAADLASPLPMHRLLQGDVGSGKTVVALAAMLYGVQGGHQGALMVPTEVLAEQHFLAARRLLEGLSAAAEDRLGGERPVHAALLTSRTPAGERSRIVAQLAAGEVDLLVGTHALITEDVRFRSLGVVVIDEQHRFGVDQRAALREKGSIEGAAAGHDPDLLVMTATPIPRTAAMTVYGDLDYSVLDELPAGRSPVTTCWLGEPEAEGRAWEQVRAEVAAGNQAFVVCPLVRAGGGDRAGEEGETEGTAEEGETEGAGEAAPLRPLRSAEAEAVRLAAGELRGCRVGLLHGQLPAREKEEVMAALRRGELDVLVATTVVEVGVDIPRATVMVVEDADRFGIAQLHQLRGRVGRSERASSCYLLAPAASISPEGVTRIEALVASSDGFQLAEVDLDLRGEGTVLGARQKGRNDLKLASLRRDHDLVLAARRVAEELVGEDPTLAHQALLADELRLFIGEEEADYLLRS